MSSKLKIGKNKHVKLILILIHEHQWYTNLEIDPEKSSKNRNLPHKMCSLTYKASRAAIRHVIASAIEPTANSGEGIL